MNRDFDVVVIGAGPAGSTAAEHASLGGARVLLLDKRKKVGEPVACGEFLPSKDEIGSMFPRTSDVEALFSVPRDLVSKEMHLFQLFAPNGKRWVVPFDGFTTDRDKFDQHLASKAEKAGAELITETKFLNVDGRSIITDKGQYSAKVVIGADGPLSTVADSLRLPKVKELYPAATVHAKGEFEPVMEMYFGGVAPGAYAWVLPKKEGANVGVGFSPRWAKGTLSQYLKKFVEQRGLEVDGKPRAKMVPASGPVGRTVQGNGMIVGDAAGHVISVNGGGIPIAMICGRIAGQVVASHVIKGTELQEYEKRWRFEVEAPLKVSVRTKQLASIAMGSNSRVNLCMSFLGSRRMGKMLRCQWLFP